MAPGDENNPQGAVQGQTPGGEGDQTPEGNQTFTRQEVEAAVAKATNNVKTDVGRLEAEWKRSQNIAEKAMARLKEIEDENYRRAEETARDDPDELTRIRARRRDAEREANLAEREAKIQTQLTQLTKVTAKALAQQYNVSEEMLLKYGGNDAERMGELAKSYGERKPAGETETRTRMTQPPDDGKTKGTGVRLTVADVQKMSPEEQNKRVAEIAKILF